MSVLRAGTVHVHKHLNKKSEILPLDKEWYCLNGAERQVSSTRSHDLAVASQTLHRSSSPSGCGIFVKGSPPTVDAERRGPSPTSARYRRVHDEEIRAPTAAHVYADQPFPRWDPTISPAISGPAAHSSHLLCGPWVALPTSGHWISSITPPAPYLLWQQSDLGNLVRFYFVLSKGTE